MSWFDAIIPPIKKRSKTAKSVPEGTWAKCQSCDRALYERDLTKGLGVCGKCGHHHHIEPRKMALALLNEADGVEEIAAGVRARDFLKFTDSRSYKERLKTHGGDDQSREALRVFQGKIESWPAVVACFDWSFMGGSMGSVVGERFMRGVDTACDRGAAFIVFTSSGGARMQEGLTSLMQMAKTTAAQAKLSRYGLPFISVLCNPTTGGVAASFAMTADIVLAEPGATIGFAGQRVIRSTVGDELPEGFQSSEFLLDHGSIDMIVDRRECRATIAKLAGALLEGRAQADE